MKRGWKTRGGNGRVNKAKCTRSDTWPRVGNRGIFLSTPFHAIVLSTFFQPFSYLFFFFFLFAPPFRNHQLNEIILSRAPFVSKIQRVHANFSTVQSSFVRSFVFSSRCFHRIFSHFAIFFFDLQRFSTISRNRVVVISTRREFS